ncbi:MAG: anti-sigma regulatory factor [Candidatus Hodarchaeales archaeon]
MKAGFTLEKTVLLNLDVRNESDIVRARSLVGEVCKKIGFRLVPRTALMTVVSELTRNAIQYATRGSMVVEKVEKEKTVGLLITVEDEGPGIFNVDRVLSGGYSSGHGLGKGLCGSKVLVDEFEIDTKIGQGTRVRVLKWS